MSKAILLMVLTGLLAGCTVQPSAVPDATPQALRVEVSSSLDWLRPGMAACVQQIPGLSLSVQTIEMPEQSLNKADILLRWSDQPTTDGYAFELGEEILTVIVHPDNPLEGLTAGEIKTMYSGQIASWPGGNDGRMESIQLWVLPNGNETQALFETSLLGEGLIVQTAMIAPSPVAMLEAVAREPGAIGFLPARWLDETVKPIEIIGYAKENLGMPILAITSIEPTGLTRDWMLCVQEQVNQ